MVISDCSGKDSLIIWSVVICGFMVYVIANCSRNFETCFKVIRILLMFHVKSLIGLVKLAEKMLRSLQGWASMWNAFVILRIPLSSVKTMNWSNHKTVKFQRGLCTNNSDRFLTKVPVLSYALYHTQCPIQSTSRRQLLKARKIHNSNSSKRKRLLLGKSCICLYGAQEHGLCSKVLGSTYLEGLTSVRSSNLDSRIRDMPIGEPEIPKISHSTQNRTRSKKMRRS